MAPLTRDKRINFQASEAEQEMLRLLAERQGVSMSDYVRQLIRQAWVEWKGSFEPLPTPPKAKARKRR